MWETTEKGVVMKIVVDQLPLASHKCLFITYETTFWGFQNSVCSFSKTSCAISKGKKCEYLLVLEQNQEEE